MSGRPPAPPAKEADPHEDRMFKATFKAIKQASKLEPVFTLTHRDLDLDNPETHGPREQGCT